MTDSKAPELVFRDTGEVGLMFTPPRVIKFVAQDDALLTIDMDTGEITGGDKAKPDEAAKAIFNALSTLIGEPQ